MLHLTNQLNKNFETFLDYQIHADEECIVIAIVRLDSIMTSMIDSFEALFNGFYDYQPHQKEKEVQIETKRY